MITGKMFRDGFISGANHIANHRQQVDGLNVFPVPDGDTGTNMSMSSGASQRELVRQDDGQGIGHMANVCASALLRGARGNSGVILSLLFRGFARGLKGLETADARALTEALESGVSSAYKAVMKPTEGTILTVAKVASQRARAALEADESISAPALWEAALAGAEEALADTPKLLPVLEKAGVVDAGGQGLVYIFAGMRQVWNGGDIIQPKAESADMTAVGDSIHPDKNAAGEYVVDITFTYCTEFLIDRTQDQERDPQLLRGELEKIGDCVVVVDDETVIKCHVHTDNPGTALQHALPYGQLIEVKIENMRQQHEQQRKLVQDAKAEESFAYAAVDPSKPFGFVCVAAGDGVQGLFSELGADKVVTGGQTMNPSTDDILSAIQATPAKTVFVLPNNKNIIMAAEQAAKLADRKAVVLPTRTIPQGLSAMMAFDGEKSLNDNTVNMKKAAEHVRTGQITFAARDSEFDGHTIKEGELLAMNEGKLAFVERDMTKAVLRLCKSLIKRDSAFVTILYGQDVSESTMEKLREMLQAKLPESVELAVIRGGQPVYYFIMSVE